MSLGNSVHFWDQGFSKLPSSSPCFTFPLRFPDHFGERSWRGVKGELLEEGETPSILAGDPEEEPTLLRLPSSNSEERHELSSDSWVTSDDNMVVVP